MPPALLHRPTLTETTYLYYEVFSALSGARQNSRVMNPISFEAVMSYCDALKMSDSDERLTYWRVIHECDIAFMEDQAERNKS